MTLSLLMALYLFPADVAAQIGEPGEPEPVQTAPGPEEEGGIYCITILTIF